MQTAHEKDSTLGGSVLTVALESASKSWKLALQDEQRERPAIATASEEGAAARLAQTIALIEAAKRKWQLIEPMRVVVMYEAGQDGFWICRALQKVGYEALVVDEIANDSLDSPHRRVGTGPRRPRPSPALARAGRCAGGRHAARIPRSPLPPAVQSSADPGHHLCRVGRFPAHADSTMAAGAPGSKAFVVFPLLRCGSG
jgi:hypothetical protein